PVLPLMYVLRGRLWLAVFRDGRERDGFEAVADQRGGQRYLLFARRSSAGVCRTNRDEAKVGDLLIRPLCLPLGQLLPHHTLGRHTPESSLGDEACRKARRHRDPRSPCTTGACR